VPTRRRVAEFALGFVLSTSLFAALALIRGAFVGASWTFAGFPELPETVAGPGIALLVLLLEELLFRGHALRRACRLVGPTLSILISAALFGIYRIAGRSTWSMGAFFAFSMPALGGLLFGFAALRSDGLALAIGLNLGGNCIQASVLSFRTEPQGGMPEALWTTHLSETQLGALTAQDFLVHLPFMTGVALALATTILVFRVPARTA
jgi:membrane protease YdiL (CAAX protease family)